MGPTADNEATTSVEGGEQSLWIAIVANGIHVRHWRDNLPVSDWRGVLVISSVVEQHGSGVGEYVFCKYKVLENNKEKR